MSGAAEQKRRARHIEVAYHEGYLAGLREGRPSVEALARALCQTGHPLVTDRVDAPCIWHETRAYALRAALSASEAG